MGSARDANDANLTPRKISNWGKGYLTTHHPSEAFNEFQASREFEIHHRRDDIFIGSVVKALLEKLPRTPQPMEKIGQALIDAAQTPFGKHKLSELMKDGSVSPTIAKLVRFVGLGKASSPTQAHLECVKRLLDYYPARIAKIGDLYQLASPTDTDQVEAFKRLMQCKVGYKDPSVDPEPENGNLTPPPAADPEADRKALVVSMRSQGHSFREIAAEVGVSLGTAHSWCAECHIRSENFLGRPYIGNSLNTSSLPKSPQPRTTTTFEADSADVTSESNMTSDMTSDMTFREQILRLLETGEKQTGEIVDAINGKRVAIMNELKRLCDAGEIFKAKRGIYDLPTRAYSIDLPLAMKTSTKPTSRTFNRLLKAKDNIEIANALIACCWEASGNAAEPPTIQSLVEWQNFTDADLSAQYVDSRAHVEEKYDWIDVMLKIDYERIFEMPYDDWIAWQKSEMLRAVAELNKSAKALGITTEQLINDHKAKMEAERRQREQRKPNPQQIATAEEFRKLAEKNRATLTLNAEQFHAIGLFFASSQKAPTKAPLEWIHQVWLRSRKHDPAIPHPLVPLARARDVCLC